MNREGEIFKHYIDNSDLTIDRVLTVTGISRGQLYSLFGKAVISEKWKEKINRLGLNIIWSTKSTENFGKKNYASPELMNQINDTIGKAKRLIQEEEDEKNNDYLNRELTEALLRDHKILQDLVEQGIKSGAIKWINKLHQPNKHLG